MSRVDASNRLDLNSCTLKQLSDIQGVSFITAKKIISLRKSRDWIDNIEDLQQSISLTRSQLHALNEHVAVRPTKTSQTNKRRRLSYPANKPRTYRASIGDPTMTKPPKYPTPKSNKVNSRTNPIERSTKKSNVPSRPRKFNDVVFKTPTTPNTPKKSIIENRTKKPRVPTPHPKTRRLSGPPCAGSLPSEIILRIEQFSPVVTVRRIESPVQHSSTQTPSNDISASQNLDSAGKAATSDQCVDFGICDGPRTSTEVKISQASTSAPKHQTLDETNVTEHDSGGPASPLIATNAGSPRPRGTPKRRRTADKVERWLEEIDMPREPPQAEATTAPSPARSHTVPRRDAKKTSPDRKSLEAPNRGTDNDGAHRGHLHRHSHDTRTHRHHRAPTGSPPADTGPSPTTTPIQTTPLSSKQRTRHRHTAKDKRKSGKRHKSPSPEKSPRRHRSPGHHRSPAERETPNKHVDDGTNGNSVTNFGCNII